MNRDTVLAKSAKGVEEIETRAHRLGARLRQALIRVDGEKTVEELCEPAGEMAEALRAQLEELQRQGFVVAISGAPVAMEAQPAPAPAAAPDITLDTTLPLGTPIGVGSPIRFKLLDLLIDAVGMDTGRLGEALERCHNRDDLVRWVGAVVKPIHEKSGQAKAKTFEKAARQLLGG